MISVGMSKIDVESALRPQQPVRQERVEAVCLYMQSEKSQCLWAVLDFMDFNLHFVNTVKHAVCQATGLSAEHVHILTTHNHGAGIPDPSALAEPVSICAKNAISSAVPAQMRYTVTQVSKQMTYIRRMEVPELDGVTTLYYGSGPHNQFDSAPFVEHAVNCVREGIPLAYIGQAETNRPYHPFAPGDPDIVAVEFRALTGAPIGTVVRFAAHVNSCNRPGSFSSDFPYYVRQNMEQAFGGTCLYLNGPCGNIAIGFTDKYAGAERPLGEAIAQDAINALKNQPFAPLAQMQDAMTSVWLPVRQEVLDNNVPLPPEIPETLPERRKYLEASRVQNTLPFLREKYTEGETALGKEICVHLGFLRLNQLIFAAFPGETFSVTGKAVQDAFPDWTICTLTEHERTAMYIPTKADCMRGGYEPACMSTAPGAEDVLRTASINAMEQFLRES